jgi:hypothetical protein
MDTDVRSYMNSSRGNVTPEAMAAAMASNIEEDGDLESEAGTDPSFDKYGGASEAGTEASVVESEAPPPRAHRPAATGSPRQSSRAAAAEKSDLLYKIDRMKKRGVASLRTVTFDDDLADIRMECERMTKTMNVDKSIKFQRSLLISFASGAEYLNSAYDPAGIKLDGWSETISDSIDSYDDVLEQLAEKYGSGPSGMPPELALIFMVLSSGAMFHLQATMFKSAGLDDVMKENPDLAKDVAAAVARSAEKKSRVDNNPVMGSMAGMMGKMFSGSGAPPMRGPDTGEVDQLLQEEDLFSESDVSEAESVIEDSRKLIMDI